MLEARVIAGTVKFEIERPLRLGRYDLWLDGRMWELHAFDFTWFPDDDKRMRLGRRGLTTRARERGLKVYVAKLVDGAITVQSRATRHGGV